MFQPNKHLEYANWNKDQSEQKKLIHLKKKKSK